MNTSQHKSPSENEIFEAIKNGGIIDYGHDVHFTNNHGTLNVFIGKILEYSNTFSLQSIDEAVKQVKIYIPSHLQ